MPPSSLRYSIGRKAQALIPKGRQLFVHYQQGRGAQEHRVRVLRAGANLDGSNATRTGRRGGGQLQAPALQPQLIPLFCCAKDSCKPRTRGRQPIVLPVHSYIFIQEVNTSSQLLVCLYSYEPTSEFARGASRLFGDGCRPSPGRKPLHKMRPS